MFGFGNKSFLGVDVGTSSVKVVEIESRGGKPVLINYGSAFLGENINKNSWESLSNLIARIIKEGKFKSREAYVSISSAGALITLIEFPKMEQEELNQAIKFEAHKYVPIPLEEIVLNWDVVDALGNKNRISGKKVGFGKLDNEKVDKKTEGGLTEITEGNMQVLLVAAPKAKIEKYEKLITGAGLELKSIEIESFSLARALIGNDQGNYIIVDIGSRICNIILVEKGIIKVNRNIDAGGLDITKAISQSMNIEEKRAEGLKISGNNFFSEESSIIFPALEIIIGEVRRVVNAYYKDNEDIKLDNIILSGGTANFQGITDYFNKNLGIKIIIGNPLSRVEYEKIIESKLNDIKTQFSVCIGLAVKGLERETEK